MVTADQFLKALAVVESSDNPEAWGDAGRAMGRWQVHPDRLWWEMSRRGITPHLNETWDQLVQRVLSNIFGLAHSTTPPEQIAMYWHLGHWTEPTAADWDGKYGSRFVLALTNAIAEMP